MASAKDEFDLDYINNYLTTTEDPEAVYRSIRQWLVVGAVGVGLGFLVILFLNYFWRTRAFAITWYTWRRNPRKNLRILKNFVTGKGAVHSLIEEGCAALGLLYSREQFKEHIAAFDKLRSHKKVQEMAFYELPGDELLGFDMTPWQKQSDIQAVKKAKAQPIMCVLAVHELVIKDDEEVRPDDYHKDNIETVRRKLLIAGDSVVMT